jgi:hypothetical protein
MRRPILGVVLILLSWAHPGAAQDARLPPFERLIDTDFEVRQLIDECTVPTMVAGLAQRYEFLAGIEYPRAECARLGGKRSQGGELLNLRGLTVGQAIEKLVALDPRYRVVQRDGVVVLRPVAAWADAANMLNFTAGSFVLGDTTLGGALDAVASAITGNPRRDALENMGTRTEQGARKFSVTTGAASAGETLDAIVRAHGAASWEMREGEPDREGKSFRSLFFRTFDGSGIGTGIRIKP